MLYPKTTTLWPRLILVLALFAGALSASAQVKVGEAFPDLATYSLEGTLPERAGRVVLIDFWATWCAPCKASFPHYSTLQTELGPRGLTVLAVSVDKKTEPYDAFLKRFAPAFSTVRDGDQKLVAKVQPPSMPTCYLIDRKGTLRLVHTGFHGEADAKMLRAEITKLLDETP